MQDSTTSVNQLGMEFPELSIQVVSFFQIGFFVVLAILAYYLSRRFMQILSSSGVIEKRSLTYQVLNISTFVLPGIIFLIGLTRVSQNSLFVSLLFFVIFSIIFGFSLIQPARNILASLFITLRGELRVGDYISLAQVEGEVLSVGAFNVQIQSKSGSKTFIPNYHILQSPFEIHAKKGGPSIMINIPSDKISKKNLERLAHLCPFKRRGSDIRISTIDGNHKLTIEIVNRQCRPWVNKYFSKHSHN
jgi:small-conductance mechanosensitive channel